MIKLEILNTYPTSNKTHQVKLVKSISEEGFTDSNGNHNVITSIYQDDILRSNILYSIRLLHYYYSTKDGVDKWVTY